MLQVSTGSSMRSCYATRVVTVLADIIASIVDEQPLLPEGLHASGSILQYVEYMTRNQRQEQQQKEKKQEEQEQQQQQGHDEDAECAAEGQDRVAAYIKGGVAHWQEQGTGADSVADALERTLQL